MEPMLTRLADALPAARSLEDVTRPLLEMLHSASGLESTYLTLIDLQQGQQRVLYALNKGGMIIPEGLSVPWDDTLCKRALEAGVPCTSDVPARWGDSAAARELGIRTYVSTAVTAAGGELLGTLCGASAQARELPADADRLLKLFARLIGQTLERERLVQRLRDANLELAALAGTDSLTGLPNRRLFMSELSRLLAQGKRLSHAVLVAMVDLDDFKQVNDRHGHAAGDELLRVVARRLCEELRSSDLAARVGGDEFAVVGPAPMSADSAHAAEAMAHRLQPATVCEFAFEGQLLRYGGASVGVVALAPGQADADAALNAADQAMYMAKRRRKPSGGLPAGGGSRD